MSLAIVLGILFGLFLAYANGANDNFKGVATLFGSGTTDYRKALGWAAVTTLAGSVAAIFLANGLLEAFKGKGLVPAEVAASSPFGLSVAFAAAATVMLAARCGFPISTTHALMGALVGAGLLASASGIESSLLVKKFLIPLVISPLIAVAGAALIYPVFRWIRCRLGITKETCLCMGTEVLASAPAPADLTALTGMAEESRPTIRIDDEAVCREAYAGNISGVRADSLVDRAHFLSAGAVSFARGLNDAPKIAALMLVGGAISPWFALSAVAAIMMTGGIFSVRRVAETMGHKVTRMNPGQGFSANLITAILVIVASKFGGAGFHHSCLLWIAFRDRCRYWPGALESHRRHSCGLGHHPADRRSDWGGHLHCTRKIFHLRPDYSFPCTSILSLSFFARLAWVQPPSRPTSFSFSSMTWAGRDTSVPFHTEPTALNAAYRTPNMERLAKRGLRFTNAYACAICSPSRVSLMTGLNAARHGVTCWTLRKDKSPETGNKEYRSAPWPLNGLQPEGTDLALGFASVTLPERLREAGYHTIHAGKGHFGAKDTPGADPSNLGFDTNIAGSYMGGPGSYHGDRNFSSAWRKGDRIWDIPGLEKYHGQKINLTEAITREVILELEKSVTNRKPFYLYLSHYAVHAPFEPDRRFLPNYKDKKWSNHQKVYASMLESMDRSLGDVLDALERLRVADNTVVVFMSDNGSPRNNPQNKPLKGFKISGYEGGTRVPMIVCWPGRTPADARTEAPVIIEDIFPTFLEIAGLKPRPGIDGISFVEILNNPDVDRSRRPLFWHYPNLYYQPPYSAVRLGKFKLIYWHLDRRIELFDLNKDLGEAKNLVSEHPGKVQELAKLLSEHLRGCKAFMLEHKDTSKQVPFPDELGKN